VVKALGREQENLPEFQFDDSMSGQLPGCLAFNALSAHCTNHLRLCIGAQLFWYVGYKAKLAVLPLAPSMHSFLSDVYDLANTGSCSCFMLICRNSIASADEFFKLMDTPPEVQDRPDAFAAGTIRGEIEFDRVDFYYEDRKPILTDFSLKVAPGETIALVGPTGGGKTTIVNLLCRSMNRRMAIFESTGTITRITPCRACKAVLVLCFQTPHLFSGTIRENIRYGQLNASIARSRKLPE